MAVTADRAEWAAYLFEMQGAVHEAFAAEAPYLAEVSGYSTDGSPNGMGRITRAMDGNRTVFSGSQVRHTVDLTTMQVGGWPGEEGTWNAPSATSAQKIFDYLRDFVQPFSLTVDVERDSFDNSNAVALTRLIQKAQQSTALNEELTFLGDGTGLIATVASNSGSAGLTIPVVAGTNWNILLPGTIWDVLTRSNGANPGNGLRRKIDSVSINADNSGSVVFDTAQQTSDGNSGNITFANTSGIYIPGSYSTTDESTSSLVPNGLKEASSFAGTTFQGLSGTTFPQWNGIDGRQGNTSVAMLSESMLMAGALAARRYGATSWDFAVGDQAAINGYIQSFFAQRLFQPDTITLKSGWSGAQFGGAGVKPFPLIGALYHDNNAVTLVNKSNIQLYGDSKGPDFLTDDGAMFRRFSRTLTKEADLLDRVQQFFTLRNSLVRFNNLDVATA